MSVSFHSPCLITFNCLLKTTLWFSPSRYQLPSPGLANETELLMVNVRSYALQALDRAFPKDRQCLWKILLEDFICRCAEHKAGSLHVLLPPNFIMPAHSVENWQNDTHQFFYSSVTTLQIKASWGDLMKQYVLGGSFRESSTQFFVFNTRGLCVSQIDKKHMKPSLVD